MKKYLKIMLTAALAGAMVLGASACAGNNGQNAGQNQASTESSAASTEESSAADESAESTESTDAEESSAAEESAESTEGDVSADAGDESDVFVTDLSMDESGDASTTEISVDEVSGIQSSNLATVYDDLLPDAVGTWKLNIDIDAMREYVNQMIGAMYGDEYSGEDLESTIDYYMDALGSVDMEMTLKDDGTASAKATAMEQTSETEDGKWVYGADAEGKDVISITISGSAQDFYYENGQLIAVGQEYMTFSKS